MKAAGAVVVALLLATGATGATSSPPEGLSHRGRYLWNFEALLHDTFGDRDVCTRSGGWPMNFVAGPCPSGSWFSYGRTFVGARHSAFHLSRRRPPDAFGNHPVPVWIRGRYVACGPGEQKFLIAYSTFANLELVCLKPLSG